MPEQNAGDIALASLNKWKWWQDALKGEFGPIHDGHPEQGYYRTKRKGGDWEPVAIFYPDGSGELVAYRNGREVRADEVWTWCCRNPITFEAYERAMSGQGWEDEPAPAIGHNSGAEDVDPFEALKAELMSEHESADAFLKKPVEKQADADMVGVWAKRLTGIKNKAEDLRKIEKQPFLDSCREVDAKWKPITEEADGLARSLKKHLEPFLIAQKRAEEERARKAREEYEAARQAEIEAARRANAGDEKARQEAEEARQRAEAAERATETKNASAGRTGSRVSVRVEKVGKVTDYAAAAAALVAMNHADIIGLIDQLANRAAKAGMPFAGMEVREIEKVV